MNKRFQKNTEEINRILAQFEETNLSEKRAKELFIRGEKLLDECYASLEPLEFFLNRNLR